MGGPTPRLSRAAERASCERHGNAKENMFVNRGWRRRLQAMLGRGMGRMTGLRDARPLHMTGDGERGTTGGGEPRHDERWGAEA